MSSQVRDVKEATDIVQIIGEKVSLQRSGKNFRGLCPFHGEKSPSFFVSPDIQSFKCFGCGESGDVFTFLEKNEGLTFAEALQVLADRAGIVLEKQQFSAKDEQRQRLFALLELAKDYYHFLLTQHQVGQVARDYLKDRGTTNQTVKDFQLGYSLPSWDGLIKFLVGKKKHQIKDLEAAGLVILRQGADPKSNSIRDYYDRFRGRVMFPLTDHRGRVVGFSGRVLNPEDKTAKYINTPETMLYHKSELLFGLSQNYQAIRQANSVVIVEGEFDMLSSVQAHVRNVVAIKGSALTQEHVKRLSRLVETVILSLDADSAGISATKRAIQLANQTESLRIRVLPSSQLEGKDPDDVARQQPELWRKFVKQSVSAYQFLIDVAFAEHSLETGEGKQAIVREVAPVLLSIPHVVERSHYLNKVAERLGVSESLLQQDIQRYSQGIAPVKSTTDVKSDRGEALSVRDKTERLVLSSLFQFNETQIVDRAKLVDNSLFQSIGLEKILQTIQSWSGEFSIRQFVKNLPTELEELFSAIYLIEEGINMDEKLFNSHLTRLKVLAIKQQIQDLTNQLEKLDSQAQGAEQEAVLRQIVQLRTQLVQYTT